MRVKHYYKFKPEVQKKMQENSLNQSNWDILRNDEAETPFSIEKDIASYEKNCMNSPEYERAAEKIINMIKKHGFTKRRTVSLGGGKGILEWHIKRLMPNLTLECSDYTEKAIEQLRKVFTALDAAYTFDMINGNYAEFNDNALLIMYRVSTEFDRNTWYKIFEKMYDAKIEYIIYVPAGLDTLKTMAEEKIFHIKNIVKGNKDVFCGWLYSEKEFLKMFHNKSAKPMYVVVEKEMLGNTVVYLLKRNE